MLRVALVMLLCAMGAIVPEITNAQFPPANAEATNISVEDRVFIASKMYASIGTYFAHFQMIPDFDLDAAYKAYLPEALKAPGRYEFDLASMAFMAQLHNGHSEFFDDWLYRKYGQPFGFRAQYIESRWIVTESSLASLQPGNTIQSIDGMETEVFFQQHKHYIAASNEKEIRTLFFTERYLFPQQFTLALADGRKVAVTRQASVPPVERKTEGRWIKPGVVAYIKIPSFNAPESEKTAMELVKQYQNAPALIVDVRGNGGGSTPDSLIDALMDRPYRMAMTASPLGFAVYKVRAGFFDQMQSDPATSHNEDYGYLEAMKDVSTNAQLMHPSRLQKPEKPLFKGRIFLLVDRHVASAAEDFVMPFKDNHRATIVGETTYGSTGQPYYYQFPNKASFRVSSKRDYFPDGSTFEGVGIQPDVEVSTTIESLKGGKDQVLARAQALAEATSPQPAVKR